MDLTHLAIDPSKFDVKISNYSIKFNNDCFTDYNIVVKYFGRQKSKRNLSQSKLPLSTQMISIHLNKARFIL